MDQEGPDRHFQGEEDYFDGYHSLCIGYKTLGLFDFHLAVPHILRIVTMDVKSESAWEIANFWKLLNDLLSEITGKEDYRFKPQAIMIDKMVLTSVVLKKCLGFTS